MGVAYRWFKKGTCDTIHVMVTVSKTEYLIFRECKKNAWLKIHRPDIFLQSGLSEFDRAIIETGNEVETYARQLFPSGVLIKGRDYEAQELTLRHIVEKTAVLFQPIFARDNFLAAVDILEFDSMTQGYFLYEVKSSNSVKEDTHLGDLAFQLVLLEKMNIPVRKAHIIHLNSEYVRTGELNIQNLFSIDDVTEGVQRLQAHTAEEMDIARGYLSNACDLAAFAGFDRKLRRRIVIGKQNCFGNLKIKMTGRNHTGSNHAD